MMLGMKTTADTITTGMKEIAEALGGGINENSLVVVEGEAKSGKSVISQYITHGILHSRDCSVAYYATEYSFQGLVEQMDSISLGIRQDIVTDRIRINSIGSDKFLKSGERGLRVLLRNISAMPARFKLAVIDTVTPFMAHVSPEVKVNFLQACKEMCGKGRSIVLVVDTHILEGKILHRAHEMSDYYLRLRSQDAILQPGQMDTRVIKILEVTKLAGADRRGQAGIKFEIKPRVGIQILPMVSIRV
jgi:archaellum biogenesis ATPase FlaH